MPATPRALRAVQRASAVAGALVLALVAMGSASLDSGCSSSASLVAAGGSCELASDCQEGLVCIPDPGAATGRTCSSNLTLIQMTEFPDATADAAPATDDDGGDGAIATYPTDSGTTPVTDSASMASPDADAAD